MTRRTFWLWVYYLTMLGAIWLVGQESKLSGLFLFGLLLAGLRADLTDENLP